MARFDAEVVASPELTLRRFGQARAGAAIAIVLAAAITGVGGLAILLGSGVGASTSLLERPRAAAFGLSGQLVAVALVLGCWLLVAPRPRAATALALFGIGLAAPSFAAWNALAPALRAGLLAVPPLAFVGLALLNRSWGQARPRPRRLIAVPVTAVAAAVVHGLGYNPFLDPGCSRTCEPASILLSHGLSARAVNGLYAVLVGATCLATVTVVARSRAPWTIRAASAVAALSLAVPAALSWWRWGQTRPTPAQDLLETFAGAVLAAVVLQRQGRTWRVRHALSRAVSQLAEPAQALSGTRGLIAVQFAVPDEELFLDEKGNPTRRDVPHSVTLNNAQGPFVRLIHDPQLDPHELLAEITPMQRLALENAKLNVLVRRRLEAVRSSQRRIVDATDAERHRIERDLHDGAQQRLVAVAMHLELARTRAAAHWASGLADAQADIGCALAALRTLAHSAYPAALADGELEVALEEAALTTHLAVEIRVHTQRDLPRELLMTIYTAVTAALRDIATDPIATHARVCVREDNDEVRATVEGDGRPAPPLSRAFADALDRVGAADGTFQRASRNDRETIVTVVLPCA